MSTPIRILYIEDNRFDQELIRDALEHSAAGFVLTLAASRPAFEREFQPDRYDAVLTDFNILGFEGLAVLDWVRSADPGMPVIFVTGTGSEEIAVEAMKRGAADYILKSPRHIQRLPLAIAAALEKKRLRDERQQMEHQVRDTLAELDLVLENTLVGIGLLREGRLVRANARLEELLGYPRTALLGRAPAALIPEESWNAALASPGHGIELHYGRPDGVTFWYDLRLRVLKTAGSGEAVVLALADITTPKLNQLRLRHLNRTLTVLRECNFALVHTDEEPQLLHNICQLLTEHGGYALAWIGYAGNGTQSIEPVARAGRAGAYLDDGLLTGGTSPDADPEPADAAQRSGVAVYVPNISAGSGGVGWRERAARRQLRSAVGLPLSNGQAVFGTLAVYAEQTGLFDAEEVALLDELSGDLAYGITALRTRAERDQGIAERAQHLEQARKSLEETIQAIATAAEMRDAYTAGHQRRVAGLAAAIAREMQLPAEQIHGLHLAGTVHDIGKIKVPAEILSKPDRLSEIEFALIKTHAEAGYEILKGIEFPWPIAQAVRQHHERLNGQGYPQGLRGDAILLEARILAVADVVEAMASHRPYRPGLGIDAALDEISRGLEAGYDPAVVAACLRLFREQGYALVTPGFPKGRA